MIGESMIVPGRHPAATSSVTKHGDRRIAMSRRFLIGAILVAASTTAVRADEKFETAVVSLEQTIQDADIEIKFDAIGGNAGLATLKVVAPDGRTVIDFSAQGSKSGMRHLTFESPEPKKAEGKLQADFPEGTYKFTANTVDGKKLQGDAALSHKFPDATSLVRPRPDEENVPVNGLQIRWKPVKDVSGLVFVLEQEATGREIHAELPAAVTSFTIPDGFMTPGTEYKVSIGTVSKSGNKSVFETSFTTAGRKQASIN
jgi:hypothetical protein